MLQITLSSQNYDITHFRQIVVKMWWLCDKTKKICITISSHFYHNLTKKILWSSLALKDSYMTILFNKWSQSDKNVMKMWWLEISTYFLVHIIWKFPPLQNLMSDARCLDVDACLSAPIPLLREFKYLMPMPLVFVNKPIWCLQSSKALPVQYCTLQVNHVW